MGEKSLLNQNNPHDLEYIYVIIPACANDKNKPLMGQLVYKVGKTNRPNFDRVREYGRGATLLMQINCNNATRCEQTILSSLRDNSNVNQHSRGREYFTTERVDIIMDTVVYYTRSSVGCVASHNELHLLGITAIVVMGSKRGAKHGYIKTITDGWRKEDDIEQYLLMVFKTTSSSIQRRGIDISSILDIRPSKIKIIGGIPDAITNGVYVRRRESLFARCLW
jgi:hypothetical protein